ncbi:arginyltransferase [Oceanisphaera profunda]|uniref:Aspartate/glutamate leucyltransferase n=1 Tax=Oceanisphaera profunda TaxID=1416627 RepID=A0A1Y0D7H7_9GAMM|nr:arginyltransferase [Oceanisphaera profunda]ART83498.1 arginyltransferase [Oceanisphaera profunda]
MMKEVNLKVGLTPPHACSYLPQQQEQLLVLLDKNRLNAQDYEQLLSAGFRRSGSDIYRPHCQGCTACQSLRIDVAHFAPTRSQKRIARNNRDIEITVSDSDHPAYFELYQRYINQRHLDGAMYPASHGQYEGFVLCDWLPPTFIEFRLEKKLVAVAVTDTLSQSMSAMYTFFEPALAHRSLGTFAVLTQLKIAQKTAKQWLYLGYQVDECAKMNYKQHFRPHQRLIAGTWHGMKD